MRSVPTAVLVAFGASGDLTVKDVTWWVELPIEILVEANHQRR